MTAASPRAPRPRAVGIPTALLLACEPFPGGIPAEQVGAAIAAGLQVGGWEEADVLALPAEAIAGTWSTLDDAGFDTRMRRARALVVAAAVLSPPTLAGSTAFDLATRARQAGVPAYAVAAKSDLGAFEARILDLQAILTAPDRRALRAAGRRLAELV